MGKNTLMKRCIRLYNERTGSDTWAPLLDALVGNVGLIFTKGDLSEVRRAPSCIDLQLVFLDSSLPIQHLTIHHCRLTSPQILARALQVYGLPCNAVE